MYLSQNIRWQDEAFNMVGTVPGDITVESRPQGRGYVVLQETGQGLWPAATGSSGDSGKYIPAHEFHYARLDLHSSEADYAFDIIRGAGIDGEHDGLIIDNLVAGFAHQRNTSSNPWVDRFVEFVREKSNDNGIKNGDETSNIGL